MSSSSLDISLREGNVFSHVCPSFCSQRESPYYYYPWFIGPHCIRPPGPNHSPPPTWDETWDPLAPPPGHKTWGPLALATQDMRHGTIPPLPPAASDIRWSSLETFSNVFIGPHSTGHLPGVTSGGGLWNLYGMEADGTQPTEMLSCSWQNIR